MSLSAEQNYDLDRAKDYAGLFVSAERQGREWHYMAPLDGVRRGDTFRLGEALMERVDDRTWKVTVADYSVVLTLRVPAESAGAS